MDHLPLDNDHREASPPENPPPQLATLALLVSRITTIKLAYWAALTAFELALPLDPRPLTERFGSSVAFAAFGTFAALLWARRSARAVDQRIGALTRSIPTIATTFVAANVVSSLAGLPLLLVERERSIESCAGRVTCHPETLFLWVAVVVVGVVAIPATFAFSMRR